MNAFIEYAVQIASKGVDEINSGYINASPYDAKSKCEYCEYGGLCGRNSEDEKGRKIGSVKTESVVEAVEYERKLKGEIE